MQETHKQVPNAFSQKPGKTCSNNTFIIQRTPAVWVGRAAALYLLLVLGFNRCWEHNELLCKHVKTTSWPHSETWLYVSCEYLRRPGSTEHCTSAQLPPLFFRHGYECPELWPSWLCTENITNCFQEISDYHQTWFFQPGVWRSYQSLCPTKVVFFFCSHLAQEIVQN